MKAGDAGHFSDVLAAAASNANTTVSGMGETFKYAGSMAGSLGYSIEDVALMTGLMANTGIKGTMAGTALNSIFTRLSTNTNGAADAMKDLGISFFDSNGQARDLSDVMGELRTATAGMTAEQKSNLANTIAGTQAQKGLLAILNASEEDYNKLADAINNADGAAANMSETMMDNLQGSITLLQSAVDGVKISFGERLSPYVRSLADWLTDQMPAVESGLDEMMDWVDTKVDRMKKKFHDLTESEEWKNADFLGKVKLSWDEFIADPFKEWWDTKGKAKFADFAGDIGKGIGSGIKIGVMTMLGIDISETFDEGTSIGASFAKGFSEGFDFDAVSAKLMDGLGNLVSNAGKLLPGGKSADLSSVFSAVLLGKIASPFISLGKGAISLGKAGKTVLGSGTGEMGLGTAMLGSSTMGTGLLGKSAMLAINLGAGNLAGGASLSAGALSAVGMGAGAGAIAGGATLVSSAMDLYKSIKSDNKDEKAAYGGSAAWKAGGVAAGAAAGAALGSVIPGLGTAVGALIGAGVGGIAGWIKGNKVKEEYQDNVEEMQKEAEKAQKIFQATGLSIEDVRFQNKALQDAMNDSEVSAEQFSAMFQEECENVAKNAFGKIKLSLEEVKSIASDITFGDITDGLNTFTTATNDTQQALSDLQSSVSTLKKENWKVSLGMKLDELQKDDYKSAIENFISDSQSYIDNNHYEATVALKLLTGTDADTSGIDSYYGSMKKQLDDLGKELSGKVDIALEDSVISLDESAEIQSLQDQISAITGKISQARTDAEFDTLKIKYSGAELDMDSFNALQEELQTQVSNASDQYEQALTLTLTNLNLQLADGAITQEEYDAAVKEATDGYYAQLNEINARVSSFNLETIAEAWDSSLQGYMPEIEGSTKEKLETALNNALLAHPDVQTWTAADVASWMGLDKLNLDTAVQTDIATQILQTALAVPDGTKEKIMQDFKDSVPTAEEIKEAIDWDSMTNYGPISNEYFATLQSEWQTAGTNLGTSLNTGASTSLTNGSAGLRTSLQTSLNTATASPFSISPTVNVTPKYNLLTLPTIPTTTSTPAKHAAGGRVGGGPQLSWLAEEGWDEFVIPTNPSRRTRALELYEQAGEALGVSKHAEGGRIEGSNLSDMVSDHNLFTEATRNASYGYNDTTEGNYEDNSAETFAPVSSEVPASTPQTGPISVNVAVSPNFQIEAKEGQSEEDIVAVIRRHLGEIADELGGNIAEKLSEVFANMPVSSTKGA